MSLDIGNARLRPTTLNHVLLDHLDVADFSLAFSDGVVVGIPFELLVMNEYDDRGRSDDFLEVLRNRACL